MRLLDAGVVTIEQVVELLRPTDLSALTRLWDNVVDGPNRWRAARNR